jgi:hypothetical protein
MIAEHHQARGGSSVGGDQSASDSGKNRFERVLSAGSPPADLPLDRQLLIVAGQGGKITHAA